MASLAPLDNIAAASGAYLPWSSCASPKPRASSSGGVRTVMTQPEELREHAERCRRLADRTTDRTLARVLLGLADEYLERAKRLERQAAALSHGPSTAPEQQPMQQQQQIQPKKEDE
jgi:hypothetical protein